MSSILGIDTGGTYLLQTSVICESKNDYISKPIDARALYTVIEKWVYGKGK